MSGKHDRLRSLLVAKAPALLYMGVIFFMSSLPGYEVPSLNFRFGDKFVHLLEFGLLGMFLYHFFRSPQPLVSHPWIATVIVGVLYAASDEIHQLFTPGRMCELADFIVDSIGVAVFAGISAKLNPLSHPKKEIEPPRTQRTRRKTE
ncbi:MAG: VanZ family protein [Candidatus Latescibacterota bacterium]